MSEPRGDSSVFGLCSPPAFLSWGSVPSLSCQHLLPEPVPGTCSHEIMGWGNLAGPPIFIRATAGAWQSPGPGASIISLVASSASNQLA